MLYKLNGVYYEPVETEKLTEFTKAELRAILESLSVSVSVCSDDYTWGHFTEKEEKNFLLWKQVSPKIDKLINSK